MRLNKYISTIFFVAMLLICTCGFSQQGSTAFKTVAEYLELSEKKYGFKQEDIFYMGQSDSKIYPQKFSMLYFIRDGQAAVIEDVAQVMKTECSPDKMMPRITLDAVKKALYDDAFASGMPLTNMLSRNVYKPGKGEIIALFLYNYDAGYAGQDYIKERDNIAKNLGIKTFIVSVDEGNIGELQP